MEMDALTASGVMNDEYAARILVWSIDKPRTASDMSQNLGIPISACYNRIRMLENLGLLRCADMKMSPSGKRIAVYQSMLRKASIFMERGEVRVKLELIDGKVEDMSLVSEKPMITKN
jgi:DNA-binding Lrp family transcriptional regulator